MAEYFTLTFLKCNKVFYFEIICLQKYLILIKLQSSWQEHILNFL